MDSLAELTRQFEAQAKQVHTIDAGRFTSIPVIVEEAKESSFPVYEYLAIQGDGDSVESAINDWWGKIPKNSVEAIIWRVRPELVSEKSFATKTVSYRVWSRFAIVPLDNKMADA